VPATNASSFGVEVSLSHDSQVSYTAAVDIEEFGKGTFEEEEAELRIIIHPSQE
jgi:hypothetical protein